MADSLPSVAQQSIAWQAYGADAKNLVCPLQLDFTTYSQYTFNPQNPYRQSGVLYATGLVVDNLLSSSPLYVMIGPLTEIVPPYTKVALTVDGTSAQVTVKGQQSKPFISFYRGDYLGTTAGINYYAAQIAAGLAVETGFINMFAGSTAAIPVGYLLCDGSAISRTTYAGLFSVIGTLYGPGDNSTTFNLPDMIGRFPVGAGAGAGLSNRALGSKGGAEQVIISATQMPVHTHGVTDNGHVHGVNDTGHVHGITDTGHVHNVGDPGHVHPFDLKRTADNSSAGAVSQWITDGGGAPNTWASPAGSNLVIAGRVGAWDNPGYDLALNTIMRVVATNVTVSNAGTGVQVKNAPTGITLGNATTGISIGTAGGSGGATQPTPTVPPYTGVNYVIKT